MYNFIGLDAIIYEVESGDHSNHVPTTEHALQLQNVISIAIREEILCAVEAYGAAQNQIDISCDDVYVQYTRLCYETVQWGLHYQLRKSENTEHEKKLITEKIGGKIMSVFKTKTKEDVSTSFLKTELAKVPDLFEQYIEFPYLRRLAKIKVIAHKYIYNNHIDSFAALRRKHLNIGFNCDDQQTEDESIHISYNQSILQYYALLKISNQFRAKIKRQSDLQRALQTIGAYVPKYVLGTGSSATVVSAFQQIKIATECKVMYDYINVVGNAIKRMQPKILHRFFPKLHKGNTLRLYSDTIRLWLIEIINTVVIPAADTGWPQWSWSMDAATMSGNLGEKVVPVIFVIAYPALNCAIQIVLLLQPDNPTRETAISLKNVYDRAVSLFPALKLKGSSSAAIDHGGTEVAMSEYVKQENVLMISKLDEAHGANTVWLHTSKYTWGESSGRFGNVPRLGQLAKSIKKRARCDKVINEAILARTKPGQDKPIDAFANTRFGGVFRFCKSSINDNRLQLTLEEEMQAQFGDKMDIDDDKKSDQEAFASELFAFESVIEAQFEQRLETDDTKELDPDYISLDDAGQMNSMMSAATNEYLSLSRYFPELSDADSFEFDPNCAVQRGQSQFRSPRSNRIRLNESLCYDDELHQQLQERQNRSLNVLKIPSMLLIMDRFKDRNKGLAPLIAELKLRMIQASFYTICGLGNMIDGMMEIAKCTSNRCLELYDKMLQTYSDLTYSRHAWGLFLAETFDLPLIEKAVEYIQRNSKFDYGKECKLFRNPDRLFGTRRCKNHKPANSFCCEVCRRDYALEGYPSAAAAKLNAISAILPPWHHRESAKYIERLGAGQYEFCQRPGTFDGLLWHMVPAVMKRLWLDHFAFVNHPLFHGWKSFDGVDNDLASCVCHINAFRSTEIMYFKFIERFTRHFGPEVCLAIFLSHPKLSLPITRNFIKMTREALIERSACHWVRNPSKWKAGVSPKGYPGGDPVRWLKSEINRRWSAGDRGASMYAHPEIWRQLETYASCNSFDALSNPYFKVLKDWSTGIVLIFNGSMMNETILKKNKHLKGQQKNGERGLERIGFYGNNLPTCTRAHPIHSLKKSADADYDYAEPVAPRANPEFCNAFPLPSDEKWIALRKKAQHNIDIAKKVHPSKDPSICKGNQQSLSELMHDWSLSGRLSYEEKMNDATGQPKTARRRSKKKRKKSKKRGNKKKSTNRATAN